MISTDVELNFNINCDMMGKNPQGEVP